MPIETMDEYEYADRIIDNDIETRRGTGKTTGTLIQAKSGDVFVVPQRNYIDYVTDLMLYLDVRGVDIVAIDPRELNFKYELKTLKQRYNNVYVDHTVKELHIRHLIFSMSLFMNSLNAEE